MCTQSRQIVCHVWSKLFRGFRRLSVVLKAYLWSLWTTFPIIFRFSCATLLSPCQGGSRPVIVKRWSLLSPTFMRNGTGWARYLSAIAQDSNNVVFEVVRSSFAISSTNISSLSNAIYVVISLSILLEPVLGVDVIDLTGETFSGISYGTRVEYGGTTVPGTESPQLIDPFAATDRS